MLTTPYPIKPSKPKKPEPYVTGQLRFAIPSPANNGFRLNQLDKILKDMLHESMRGVWPDEVWKMDKPSIQLFLSWLKHNKSRIEVHVPTGWANMAITVHIPQGVRILPLPDFEGAMRSYREQMKWYVAAERDYQEKKRQHNEATRRMVDRFNHERRK